ncbi:hypothetical protein BC941DRAFT_453266 [Chlamydoabsidia padenii]|nr:hypothetical protein BC941DRAFT_453266 [Chlamydoabsidia padenii]
MRFSILSFALVVLLFVCHVCGTAIPEPKVNELMMFRRAETGHTVVAEPEQKKKKKAPTIWASPEILQNGTLFYIAISISTLLWCTGKGVDMTLDQLERKAEFEAQR